MNGHNPDILTCLANLSADEVFTPPKLASAMLDILPQELFQRPDTTFLDPVCKSGVFLREIARRLNDGLKDQMPDEQARINHILSKQVFGLAITELTALLSRRSVYCSKKADGKYSLATAFSKPDGNIRLPKTAHTWNAAGRCEFCGASDKAEYGRDDTAETHAYPFIHCIDPTEVFNVKFDVIIGNPPYQLSDGGFGRSAAPIYHEFVSQAKKLEPRFLSMVIPSRWFGGGKGLSDFRSEMLGDTRIRKIVDYPAIRDLFPSIDLAGGACYFLWDRDNPGSCEVVNRTNNSETRDARSLDEFTTFIRDNRAVRIVRKVLARHGTNGARLSRRISQRKPFGMGTNYKPHKSGIPCWFIQRIGLKYADPADVMDGHGLLNKWKLLVPFAPIAGQTDFTKPVGFYYDGNTRITKPGECCTESFLVAGAFDTKTEALAYKSYLFTKTVRFLLLQAVVSQHVTRDRFYLIPDLGKYEGVYTDEMLVEQWGLSKDDWDYINSRINNPGNRNEPAEVTADDEE